MINWSIENFTSLPSTQNYLKELVESNPALPEGTVICADNQSNGYGRYGREWHSGEGNLYLSFLIRPKCNISKIGQISLLTGLALSKAIEADVVLKWPNDILIEDKKCCGILLEYENDCLIIGIGVNINSAPINTATFLQKYSNNNIDMQDFTSRLLSNFSAYYEHWKNHGFNDLRDEWLSQTYDKGQKISVKINDNHIRGSFKNIDMFGNLILICDKSGEEIKITSGEVICC